MKDAQCNFNTKSWYRIELQGQLDVEWLQHFDLSAEIVTDESGGMGDITAINVHLDQSGLVGLVRKLHGLGITILQLQIVAS